MPIHVSGLSGMFFIPAHPYGLVKIGAPRHYIRSEQRSEHEGRKRKSPAHGEALDGLALLGGEPVTFDLRVQAGATAVSLLSRP